MKAMDLCNEMDCLIYDIEAENALRFVLTDDKSISIKLLVGFAEILGTELVKDEVYTFLSPCSVSLFSWQGCKVKFIGKARKIWVENQSTSMFISAYMHACLEERRIKAETAGTRGPVCLVIGAKDVGKSSLCRVLVNYAARQGRCPMFVDLDVDQNSAALPGTVSLLAVDKPCGVFGGFDQTALSVYSFGYVTPVFNLPLYLLMMKNLGNKMQGLMKGVNNKTYFSGAIIDTYGWVTSESYSVNKLIASAFGVDVIFVIDDKTLCLDLRNALPCSVEVVLIPKTPAESRRKVFRSRCRDNRMFDYFYGLKKQLNPYTFNVNFSEIGIYKICTNTSTSDIPNYEDVSFDDIKIVQIPFGKNLRYHILSLSYCDTPDENLIKTNILGFVCVIDVCLKNKFVTLLSPQPYPLPSKILLIGQVKLK